jgi:post-segregation antitoxin (ccd killing protein)
MTKWYQVTVRGETAEYAVMGHVNVSATSKRAALTAAAALSADSVQWFENDDRVLSLTRALHAEQVSL